MKRSIFFLIIAILNGIMGAWMTFATGAAAQAFGLATDPQMLTILRSMGTLLLSIGILDFLVRNEADSSAMRAILIFNFVGHGLGLFFGLLDITRGVVELAKVGPGLMVPLIGTVGSLFYLLKMKSAAAVQTS